MLNEETYVTGSNESSLAVWSIAKKKPIYTVKKAHNQSIEKSDSNQTSWISAVSAYHNSDLIASGKLTIKYKVKMNSFLN